MIHNTKKGTGRSLTNGIERVESHAGSKLDKKIHFGVCGLRNGVGLAGRLALEGKLCKPKNKRNK